MELVYGACLVVVTVGIFQALRAYSLFIGRRDEMSVGRYITAWRGGTLAVTDTREGTVTWIDRQGVMQLDVREGTITNLERERETPLDTGIRERLEEWLDKPSEESEAR